MFRKAGRRVSLLTSLNPHESQVAAVDVEEKFDALKAVLIFFFAFSLSLLNTNTFYSALGIIAGTTS